MPITKRTQAVLKKAILKQTMEDDQYTMNRSNIMLDKVPLGKGNFGDVYSGSLRDSGRRVAVKTCRSEHIPETQQFLSEAKILKQYNHPNIVRLLGVCADKEPVYIVMELMTGGDFLHFLRKQGINQTPYQLTKFSLDAALGMEYLASQNCIHRDLAARNCLVGDNNEVLKISDFGMSRETEEGIYTPSSGARPIPVKWTAPEVCSVCVYCVCTCMCTRTCNVYVVVNSFISVLYCRHLVMASSPVPVMCGVMECCYLRLSHVDHLLIPG